MASDPGNELQTVEAPRPEQLDGTFTFTQYGVRMPNGAEVWAPVHFQVGGQVVDTDDQNAPTSGQPFHSVDLRRLEEERMRESPGVFSQLFADELARLSGVAYLDADDYAGKVHVIRRDLVLTIGAGRVSVPATKYAGGWLS